MEKLDAFTRYLGNCGLFHFFDAIQKWVLVFTGIIVFVLTIATVFLRYVLTMNVLGLDEIILLVIFWQYFIGAAQGSREDSQIKADMVSTVVKIRLWWPGATCWPESLSVASSVFASSGL